MKKFHLQPNAIHNGILLLVNAQHRLRDDFRPPTLVAIDPVFPDIKIALEARNALRAVLQAINNPQPPQSALNATTTNSAINNPETPARIIPVSGYRTLAEQQQIIADSIKENGEEFTARYVALPNASEHQTGLAIDLGLFTGETLDFIRPSFPRTGLCEQFRKVAPHYGFTERYRATKQPLTGIAAEEWHFRYVGRIAAEILAEHDWCLEELMENLWCAKKLATKSGTLEYINADALKNPTIELSAQDFVSGDNVNGFIIARFT